MVEELKKLIKSLEEYKEFKSFKKENPDAYLSSCIIIVEGKQLGEWQINYYLPDKCKMTTFVIKDPVQVINEQDIFQKEKSEVKELLLKDVKINLEKSLELLEKLRKKKYAGDFSGKVIAVLQVGEDETVWNLTMMTATLKVLNVKLKASDGRVISDSIESFMSFKAS